MSSAARWNAGAKSLARWVVSSRPLDAVVSCCSGSTCAAAVPKDTASSTAPESCAAATACASVALLPSSWPSVSNTIVRDPVVPTAFSASNVPSYNAVFPVATRAAIRVVTAARSVVGGTTRAAAVDTVISPTLTSGGTAPRNACAAFFAPSRPGPFMLPLMSTTSTAVLVA